MSMKGQLDRALDYLDDDIRQHVIDDVLRALVHPTDFMIAAGAHQIRRWGNDKPASTHAEWVFQAMIDEAKSGG